MLYTAHRLAEQGAIRRPLHIQFVLGIGNALPVRRSLLEFLVSELAALEPDATWGAAGLGRHQLEVNRWCLQLGGHCRTDRKGVVSGKGVAVRGDLGGRRHIKKKKNDN